MSIRRLQQTAISKLRSGIAINTVVQCVQELIENAIDAESTCIAVRLDLQFFKIQVIDNGFGICLKDFELLGERYATSKCHSLSDLDVDSGLFGYRGEALASICNISQSFIISSRSKTEGETWSKTFVEGIVSPEDIQKSVLERPSSGTTATVIGFLHSLPVRRQSIDIVIEIEKVKHSMESIALAHPNISFSLRNDSIDAWCFQVPKTSSVVSTFAHMFGSDWSRLFKALSVSDGPYTLRGHVAIKGHRNKSMQFLYVRKRRLSHGKVQHLINQIACKSSATFPRDATSVNEDFPKSPTFQKTSTCIETFPVYILEIDCPKDFYDFRLHPTKTVVEFQQFKLLCELVSRAFSDFFTIEKSSNVNKQQLATTTTQDSLQINVYNCVNSLHSLPVKRPYNFTNKDSSSTEVDSDDSNLISKDSILDKQASSACSVTLGTPPSCGIASIRSVKGPTLKISTLRDNFSSQSDISKDRPIRLTTKVNSNVTPLGRLINKKEQQQRLKRALRNLKKFSRKTPSSSITSKHDAYRRIDDCSTSPDPNINQQSFPSKIPVVRDEMMYSYKDEKFVEHPERSTRKKNNNTTSDEVGMSVSNKIVNKSPKHSLSSPDTLLPRDSISREGFRYDLKVGQDEPSRKKQNFENLNSNKLARINEECPRAVQSIVNSGVTKHKMNEDINSLDVSTLPPNWVVGVDGKNRDFYIAPESGNSYYGCPPSASCSQEAEKNFGPMVSGKQLPMGKSLKVDLVADDGDSRLATTVLPPRPWGVCSEKEPIRNDEVIELFHAWKNPIFEADYHQMTSVQELGTFVNPSLPMTSSGIKSYVFSKDIFKCLEVIAQVDQKFILCLINGRESQEVSLEPPLLILFDQHAVHERIRLEELIKEAEVTDSSGSLTTQRCSLDPPLVLHFPASTVRLCVIHKSQLQKKGLEVSRNQDTILNIHSVPQCLMEREVSECKLKRSSVLATLVENMLKDLVEALEEYGTFGDIMPKITLDVLKSQACHGAIKFGEQLSLNDCQNLITMLAKCKLPFCCAHGRPSVVPLVDLDEVQQITATTTKVPQSADLQKLRLKMKSL